MSTSREHVPKKTLGTFSLVMINVVAIAGIGNWAIGAAYGASAIFYFCAASLLFFIPTALVSAELATGWPERGGIFVWVKEAFGHRWGFLAIWAMWVSNVVWYPTIMTATAALIAYAFDPKLLNNNIYLFFVIFGTYWISASLNILGMRASGFISSIGAIVGMMIPGVVIIGLGIAYFFSGNPLQIDFTLSSILPNLSSPNKLALLAAVLNGFAGIEMSAVHAREVKDPNRDFPKAILWSVLIIVGTSLLGTLSIAIAVPLKDLNLAIGGVEAVSAFMKLYGLTWVMPVIATCMIVGNLSAITTWAIGPTKGLLAAAQSGDLPPIMHKMNKRDVPTGALLVQGIIVSCLALILFLTPTIMSYYVLLLDMMSQLYLIMYFLMFSAAIYLRYKRPDTPRPYTIPGGKLGMWLVSSIGILGSLFAFIFGFATPSQEAVTPLTYATFLVVGLTLICLGPSIILLFKKPSWEE